MAIKKLNQYNFLAPIENNSLIGHTEVIQNFMDAFSKRAEYPIHPVWMLTGPRGIGKATLAYHMARFILKNQQQEMAGGGLFGESPVNSNTDFLLSPDDNIFKKMIDGGFGDFFILDIEHNIDKDGKSKTDGKQISVYTIRAMIQKMQMSSMEGGWRIVIVDSMDQLNQAASNAMLKILEEPPANTIFILVVHQLSKILPTIRSRSRVEKMRPLTPEQLRELFYIFLPDEDLPYSLIKLASGSFGRIADLKRTGGAELYQELLEILNNSRANSADIMPLAISISKDTANFGILLDAIAHFGLADLYPNATREIAAISNVYLEPEVAIFKIINDIKMVVQKCS